MSIMKLHFKTSVAALLLACSSAYSASITVSNFVDFPSTNLITDDAGVPLGDGVNSTFAAAGYFKTLSDAGLMSLDPTAFALILGGTEFDQFGGNVPTLGAGLIQGSPSAAILAGSPFIGKSVYTLIGNAATLAASTELLIFKHSEVFAQDAPAFSGNALIDENAGNNTLLWGSLGKTTSDLNVVFAGSGGGVTSNYSTIGTVVPEPSRMLLAGLGLMGLMLRRRRA